jgi:hypothetical protein
VRCRSSSEPEDRPGNQTLLLLEYLPIVFFQRAWTHTRAYVQWGINPLLLARSLPSSRPAHCIATTCLPACLCLLYLASKQAASFHVDTWTVTVNSNDINQFLHALAACCFPLLLVSSLSPFTSSQSQSMHLSGRLVLVTKNKRPDPGPKKVPCMHNCIYISMRAMYYVLTPF